ncbi:MAG: peptidoglycan DD-metalloendopeptidase family protein [Rhodoferax sp.]|nr:peptidoglycan DD-metalloendopeptidase family protein [Rhodoferax sp.]
MVWTAAMLATTALVACTTTAVNHAPVVDRTEPVSGAASAGSVVAAPVKPPPGFENAGKPGYYTVKSGDTLIRIGLESGQSHKDIARWNTLENPNRIEVGQVLRVVPPAGEAVVAVSKPISSGTVVTTPLPSVPSPGSSTANTAASAAATPSMSAASAPVKAASAAATAASVPSKPAAPASTTAVASGSDDDLGWIWPGKGAVIGEFDEARNKGVDIAGNAGDAVLAAADGKVVYAGAGLRGYGNLIILKHNNTYLTAYAHNQTLMVKEDQAVKKGQKIAEMGSSDADRVKLHFEVRRQGKPVDPLKYLPAK